jgi:ammonium transporter Rh
MVYKGDSFTVAVGLFQTVIFVLYILFVRYGNYVIKVDGKLEVDHYYPLYQDIHVMVFVGFGFLMTFLSKYGFSAVGLNFFLSALTIQWSVLTRAFWDNIYHNEWKIIEVSTINLIAGDFSAAVVLITFGAVLGTTTPLQLFWIAVFETVFSSLNEMICVKYLKAIDMGGSMYIHLFGAFFGLACSWVLSRNNGFNRNTVRAPGPSTSVYHSDLFAMIGTLFLWMFWPSFNGALAGPIQQHRVIINTVLSLCGSCMAAFVISRWVGHGKIDMIHIQNATLAGGVAVGSSSDLVIQPWGAILIGLTSGTVSVLGFKYLSQYLKKKIGLWDTCGVLNLHGIPGLIGGISGAISASIGDDNAFGQPIGTIFPARDPAGDARSAARQAGFQLAAVFVSLAISIASGLLLGAFLRLFTQGTKQLMHDEHDWELPEHLLLLSERDIERTKTEEDVGVELVPVALNEMH